jgi:hypothetical protein
MSGSVFTNVSGSGNMKMYAGTKENKMPKIQVTDGHNACWTAEKWIGCECGWTPGKMSARNSTQHVAHMTHRRGLKLQPIEYQWSDTNYHRTGALSVGGLMQVKNAEWRNGGWVRV